MQLGRTKSSAYIPLGAALGILVLKEKITLPKLAGAIIMFAGLILLALG